MNVANQLYLNLVSCSCCLTSGERFWLQPFLSVSQLLYHFSGSWSAAVGATEMIRLTPNHHPEHEPKVETVRATLPSLPHPECEAKAEANTGNDIVSKRVVTRAVDHFSESYTSCCFF